MGGGVSAQDETVGEVRERLTRQLADALTRVERQALQRWYRRILWRVLKWVAT